MRLLDFIRVCSCDFVDRICLGDSRKYDPRNHTNRHEQKTNQTVHVASSLSPPKCVTVRGVLFSPTSSYERSTINHMGSAGNKT